MTKIILAALLGALCVSVVFSAPALPESGSPPSISQPVFIRPMVMTMKPGNQCKKDFFPANYRGMKKCVRCAEGFKYTQFKGEEKCLRCPAGYMFAKYRGEEKCVKCPVGYTFKISQELCVKP